MKHILSTLDQENYKDNSYYFIPARAKICSVIQFCNQIRIEYFKENIF